MPEHRRAPHGALSFSRPLIPSLKLTGVALLLAAGLSAGCAGPFQSVADMSRLALQTDPDQVIKTARIDPRYAYLRVQGPVGPAALMVLGYEDTGPQGPVQTWYSAGQETLQLVQGRLRTTHGLPRNRLSTEWPGGLPDLRLLAPMPLAAAASPGSGAVLSEQIIDLTDGGTRRLTLQVRTQVVTVGEVPNAVSATVRGDPPSLARWRWLREELRIAQPGHPQQGQLWATQWMALTEEGWVFSYQCIAPDNCLSLQPWPAAAQALKAPVSPLPGEPTREADSSVQEGERASEWLLRSTGPLASNGVAHWLVDQEREAQTRLKEDLRRGLEAHAPATLQAWLRGQPVTGRVPMHSSQARSLQARPADDPILSARDRMRWYALPRQVAVVDEQGRPCLAPHVAGAYAADYVKACSPAAMTQAWVVQPEGTIERVGLAAWNRSSQPEPAPGAWIWAPADQAGLKPEVSERLARWLATQPPPSEGSPGQGRPAPRAAQPSAVRPLSAALTASDWGEIGLLQTPTARMAPAGAARFNITRISPYTHGNVMLQPIDWLEFGFRYTNLANQLYGPSIAGNQDLKDKSIDVKVRLLPETAWRPEVALGIRDLGGTGLFSGEYLVASKRWGPWDFSLGLGWGYLGARGQLGNPLSALSDRWGTRPPQNTGQGGVPGVETFFRGPTALFGGAQYQLNERWVFKAEYEGNDYQREPHRSVLRQNSPVNLGVVFRQNPWLDWALGLERGNTLMLGLTLHTGPQGLQGMIAPKVLDPALPPVHALPIQPAPNPATPAQSAAEPARPETASPRQNAPAVAPDLPALKRAILQKTGWTLKRLSITQDRALVHLQTDAGVHARDRLEAVTQLLHAALPAEVRQFELTLAQRGLPLARARIDRAAWVQARLTRVPPSIQGQATALSASEPDAAAPASQATLPDDTFTLSVGPSYQQILGGPDGFLLFRLGAQFDAQWHLTPGTWLAGSADLRLIDNYDRFKYTAPSDLPRVRTFAREYATASRFTLPLLQAQHVQALGAGHHVSLYGGLLEPMYGGVGAEWFWRPWRSRLALGLDLNRVRQRDFEQDFGFRDYRVTTGHLSVYWDTGWHDLQAKLMIGQYLAGDVGATLDIRRQFANGIAIGAWATKTNVSAAQFGEGSFDKGIYLSVPFDVLLSRSTAGIANLVYNPLTRDGGARLNRRYTLEELTRQGSAGAWSVAPPVTSR